jgi:adenosine deaminase
MPEPTPMPDFRPLPKIELHCHLDASVRVATVAELGREVGLKLPNPLREALVAPEICADLADYIRRIDPALEVMQQPGHLTRIAREFVGDLSADGVIYGEVRFAPQSHTRAGLSMQQVLEAVHAGLAAGTASTGVRVGLIVCCLRHQPVELSQKVARLAADNRDKVCALDLAGDEARYGGVPHRPAFDLAQEAGLRRTVHAGEAAGGRSVWEALQSLAAERIGHGVRVEEESGLLEEIRRRGVALEMCPRSNVQTRAVPGFHRHPIHRLLKQGVKVTVSTDGRTLSDSTVSGEFQRLAQQFGWGRQEFWQCQVHAAQAAFLPDADREALRARIEAAQDQGSK